MAGLFHGSQMYGADDELSQDHGWGPMFTLFLSEKDYMAFGEELARLVRLDAPREWQGFHFHFPDENIDVTSLERFFKDGIDPLKWRPQSCWFTAVFHQSRYEVLRSSGVPTSPSYVLRLGCPPTTCARGVSTWTCCDGRLVPR